MLRTNKQTKPNRQTEKQNSRTSSVDRCGCRCITQRENNPRSKTDVGFGGFPLVERVSQGDALMKGDVSDANGSAQRHVDIVNHTKL